MMSLLEMINKQFSKSEHVNRDLFPYSVPLPVFIFNHLFSIFFFRFFYHLAQFEKQTPPFLEIDLD